MAVSGWSWPGLSTGRVAAIPKVGNFALLIEGPTLPSPACGAGRVGAGTSPGDDESAGTSLI